MSENNFTATEIMPRPLSDGAYTGIGIYVALLGIIAFLGNIFVLVVLAFGRPNFHRIHTVLLATIASYDLILSSTAYPVTAIAAFYKRWIFGEEWCTITGFIVYFFYMAGINSLCILAIARYIIVCRPHYEYLLQKKNTKWILAIVWLYALFWTGSPLLGWSSYTQEPFKTSCTVNWFGRSTAAVTYNVLCVVFCYLLPVAIFIFCYYNVVRLTIDRTRSDIGFINNRIHMLERSNRLTMELAIERLARSQKIRATRHMTLVCLAMVIAFAIIWTPYAVLTIWSIVLMPSPPAVHVIPTMFAKLSCAVNPFLYCLLCERFREAARRVFYCPENLVHPNMDDQGQLHSPRKVTVHIEQIGLKTSHRRNHLFEVVHGSAKELPAPKETMQSCSQPCTGES